jgi:hypothetical protein
VTGTVTQVRMAPDVASTMEQPRTSAGGRRTAASRRGNESVAVQPVAPQRISEHDPIWHEAVVTVKSVEKGKTTQKQVTVRFPSSNDVRWRYHPKFKVGQQGVFLLSDEEETTEAAPRRRTVTRGGAVAMRAVPVPAAATPMQAMSDPQPMSSIDRVRELLNAPSTAIVGGRTPEALPRTTTRKTARKTSSKTASKTTRPTSRTSRPATRDSGPSRKPRRPSSRRRK